MLALCLVCVNLSRNTLSLFSWLAVESLAHAAESANLPVRMGVSKPFGASSVVSDYQSQRFNGSSRFHPRRGRSLGRQLHIRSALPAFDVSCSNPVPTPPITGIRLVPRQRNNLDVSKDEEGGSLQEDPEYAIDFSDSDIPMSDIGNDSFDGARHRHETFLPRAHSPEEIRIDLGSSSDEDDPFIDLPFIPSHHGNVEGDNEAGFGEIYPYAWALDGRRIGENAPMGRPASPSSTFMVSWWRVPEKSACNGTVYSVQQFHAHMQCPSINFLHCTCIHMHVQCICQ